MSSDNKYIREHSPRLDDLFITRRQFLQRAGMGFGMLGLAALLGEELMSSTAHGETIATLAPRDPPLPAKAKHVVHIFAQGAPSHVDTWDHKPALVQYDGKELPGMDGVAMASPFKFEKKGKCGTEVSEVFPKLGDRKVFLIHTQNDEVIPVSEFHRLIQAGGTSVADNWLVGDSKHVRSFQDHPGEYVRRLVNFFNIELK